MMNGELRSHGWEAISIPARGTMEFNERMTDLYSERNGSRMLEFLYFCQPQDKPDPIILIKNP